MASAAPMTHGLSFSIKPPFRTTGREYPGLWFARLFEHHLHHVHAFLHLLHALHHLLAHHASAFHLTHHRAVHHHVAAHHSHAHATPGTGTPAAHHAPGRGHTGAQRLHVFLHELLALGWILGFLDLVHLRAQLVDVFAHLLHGLFRVLGCGRRRGGWFLIRVVLINRRSG